MKTSYARTTQHQGTQQVTQPTTVWEATADAAIFADPMPELTEKLRRLHQVPECMKTEEELRAEDPTQYG